MDGSFIKQKVKLRIAQGIFLLLDNNNKYYSRKSIVICNKLKFRK
jgi:hypothetical protein